MGERAPRHNYIYFIHLNMKYTFYRCFTHSLSVHRSPKSCVPKGHLPQSSVQLGEEEGTKRGLGFLGQTPPWSRHSGPGLGHEQANQGRACFSPKTASQGGPRLFPLLQILHTQHSGGSAHAISNIVQLFFSSEWKLNLILQAWSLSAR